MIYIREGIDIPFVRWRTDGRRLPGEGVVRGLWGGGVIKVKGEGRGVGWGRKEMNKDGE